eukprot:1700624-Prymnesium_polylepis.2
MPTQRRERAALILQACCRGALARGDVRRSRAAFEAMLREIEGDDAAQRLSWGARLCRPRFGRTAPAVEHEPMLTVEAPSEMQPPNEPHHVAQQLESEISWLKQALHAQRQVRRVQGGQPSSGSI